MAEVAESHHRRNGDLSGSEASEENAFSSDSEEGIFSDEDSPFDTPSSDEEWMPETARSRKRPRQAVLESSSDEADDESDDERHIAPSRKDASSRRANGRGQGRVRALCEHCSASHHQEERWFDMSDPDLTPDQPTFRPSYSPGPKLIHTASYTALQLFKFFFTNSVIETILKNSNEYGRKNYPTSSKPWADITQQDMFSFMSLVIYMGIVKCSAFADYWKKYKLYSLPFPRNVMTGQKFFRINSALHLSSTVDDRANDSRRGTETYDRLCKIKPLYEELRSACRNNYHPAQDIFIDEQMAPSKAGVILGQYMKNKPVRWGYKMFALVDSKSGYTWDFFVYDGKKSTSGKGLSYDTVMKLVDTRLLGTGYKLFVDNFFTSPTLFRDLLHKRVWACGTIRSNIKGFPKTKLNSLNSKSPRGSVRWIRKDSLLFVQWKDTKDVSLCSTLHSAHGEEIIRRRVKGDDGKCTTEDIALPPAVKEYNQCMGGLDRSDTLINYYKVLRKTHRWYKTFFYHFMDIAIMNAFILHKQLLKGKAEKPMSQKAFRETLALQLAEIGSSATNKPTSSATSERSSSVSSHHRPLHISGNSTKGRLKCRKCHAKTPVKCATCDMPLCFVPNRDCYNSWHCANGL